MKKLLILLLLSLIYNVNQIAAQKEEFYQAFVTNNPDTWRQLLDQSLSNSYSSQNTLQNLEYLYGYIGWCIRDQRKEEAKKYLKIMEKLLDQNLSPFANNLYRSITLSYGILLGTRNPVINGPKIIKTVNKAIDEDASSPLGYIQKGNAYLNMPAVFGGSKSKALSFFIQAEKIFETTNNLTQNWLYLHLLCLISETYKQSNKTAMANNYYEKIKKLEPSLFWLRQQE